MFFPQAFLDATSTLCDDGDHPEHAQMRDLLWFIAGQRQGLWEWEPGEHPELYVIRRASTGMVFRRHPYLAKPMEQFASNDHGHTLERVAAWLDEALRRHTRACQCDGECRIIASMSDSLAAFWGVAWIHRAVFLPIDPGQPRRRWMDPHAVNDGGDGQHIRVIQAALADRSYWTLFDSPALDRPQIAAATPADSYASDMPGGNSGALQRITASIANAVTPLPAYH